MSVTHKTTDRSDDSSSPYEGGAGGVKAYHGGRNVVRGALQKVRSFARTSIKSKPVSPRVRWARGDSSLEIAANGSATRLALSFQRIANAAIAFVMCAWLVLGHDRTSWFSFTGLGNCHSRANSAEPPRADKAVVRRSLVRLPKRAYIQSASYGAFCEGFRALAYESLQCRNPRAPDVVLWGKRISDGLGGALRGAAEGAGAGVIGRLGHELFADTAHCDGTLGD